MSPPKFGSYVFLQNLVNSLGTPFKTGAGPHTRTGGCTPGRPRCATNDSFCSIARRVPSVLSGRACSLLRTTRAAPSRLRRVQRNWSEVKRPTQSREHSALVSRDLDAVTERKQFMAEMTQLANPARRMDANCLQHHRGHSQKVARHHLSPCLHVPGAERHVSSRVHRMWPGLNISSSERGRALQDAALHPPRAACAAGCYGFTSGANY